MLSPSTFTRIGTDGRFGNVIVHPDVSPVAFKTYCVTEVSLPLSGVARNCHFPATSPSAIVAGGATGSGIVISPTPVSIVASSALLAQARALAMQQQIDKRNIVPIEPPFAGVAAAAPPL